MIRIVIGKYKQLRGIKFMFMAENNTLLSKKTANKTFNPHTKCVPIYLDMFLILYQAFDKTNK